MGPHIINRPAITLVGACLLLALTGCSASHGAAAPAATTIPSLPVETSVSPTPMPESTTIVGTPSTSGPKAVDDAFLASWHTFFPNESDTLSIAMALNICDSFKVGNSYAEESKTLQADSGVGAGDAAFMIGTAEIAYCPEFSGNM